MKELLENYPDLLNLEDSDGQTELRIAAGEGDLDVVKFLLTLGANTDVAGDSKAASALQIAVLYEHEMVVEELLMSGANPDAINGEGYSARMYAEDALNGEIKKLLK